MRRCFKCGLANEHGNVCGQCGATLPKVELGISGDAATTRQRVKYDMLRSQLGKVRGGQLSWQDFSGWLEGFHDDISTRMQSLVESIQQSQGPGWTYYEEFTDEVETTFSGLEDYEKALEMLWGAVDSQSLPQSESALAIFLRGAEKLNDALALNAQAQATSLVDGFFP